MPDWLRTTVWIVGVLALLLTLVVGYLMWRYRIPPRGLFAMGAAAIYLISPIDLVPEAILGPLGLVDDAGVVAASVQALRAAGYPRVAILGVSLGAGFLFASTDNAGSFDIKFCKVGASEAHASGGVMGTPGFDPSQTPGTHVLASAAAKGINAMSGETSHSGAQAGNSGKSPGADAQHRERGVRRGVRRHGKADDGCDGRTPRSSYTVIGYGT
jgi:uncharacterized membrane protein YkvA (DUF1232 family)